MALHCSQFILDVHTHSVMSGHAYGTIREMAQAAGEKGLKLLGISEHGPMTPGAPHPIYFSNLGAAPKEKYGVRLVYGCELNILNGGRLDMEEYLDRLDYVVAGIHTLCYEDEGAQGNTDNALACMAHPLVRFISHPDDDATPLDYERLVQGAKEHRVALEVNNSSFRKLERGAQANYRRMLALCSRYGVPVLVSSDAHDPDHVGWLDQAVELLNEVDFPEELILNLSVERFLKFIEK